MNLLSEIITIDTETTGLGPNDQIIQLSIVNLNNEVLFNEYFNPTVEINNKAAEVHGLTLDFLEKKPLFDEFKTKIAQILDNKIVIGYKVDFDLDLLDRHFKDSNGVNNSYSIKGKIDLINIYAHYYGVPSKVIEGHFLWQKLTIALQNMGINNYISNNNSYQLEGFHNSLTDVRATNELFFKLVNERPDLINNGIYTYLGISETDFHNQVAAFRNLHPASNSLKSKFKFLGLALLLIIGVTSVFYFYSNHLFNNHKQPLTDCVVL